VNNFEAIRVEKKIEGVLVVRLDRPQSLNAINEQLVSDLGRMLQVAEADTGCRVLILTGAGRAFCAGSDLSALGGMDARRGFEHVSRLAALVDGLERLRQPVIAAINGACFGGGLELALGCTLRVACESAGLGLPETKVGVVPGAGGVERLQRLVGFGRTARMVMTGERLTAQGALDTGLVDAVCADGDELDTALELADAMLEAAPLALESAKRCLYATRDMEVVRGTEYSMHECCLLFDTRDKSEGVRAFLEKRKPEFKGS
jgi:enoyl-CoA hydratase/carnithine racemase